MSSISRRTFLRFLPQEITDTIQLPGVLQDLFKSPKSPLGLNEEWHPASRLSALPPGTRQELNINGEPLILVSCPIGIHAFLPDRTAIASRAQSGCGIEVNFSQYWPENRVLSHLSNEPTDCNDQHELNSQRGEDHER